jgi:hypothetical protein
MAQAMRIKGHALLRGQFWCKFVFCRTKKMGCVERSGEEFVINIPVGPLAQVTRQRNIKEKATGHLVLHQGL